MRKLGFIAIASLAACSTQAPKSTPDGVGAWVSKPTIQRPVPETLKPAFVNFQSQAQSTLITALQTLRIPDNTSCSLTIFQLPGGKMIKVNFNDCHLPTADQDSARSMLLWKSLPYSGFESVFARELHVTICSPKALCDQ